MIYDLPARFRARRRRKSSTFLKSKMTKRVNVLGTGISVLNLRTALDAIADAVRARRKGYVCVTRRSRHARDGGTGR